MDEDPKKRILVDSLRRIRPEMQEMLKNLKGRGRKELARPDSVWHILLQSFAT